MGRKKFCCRLIYSFFEGKILELLGMLNIKFFIKGILLLRKIFIEYFSMYIV